MGSNIVRRQIDSARIRSRRVREFELVVMNPADGCVEVRAASQQWQRRRRLKRAKRAWLVTECELETSQPPVR